MTEPQPAPLPIVSPGRVEEMRLPKRLIAGMVLAAMFGASATVASIITAKTVVEGGATHQEDVEKNREYLQATCENTRAITEQFASAPASPCPEPE